MKRPSTETRLQWASAIFLALIAGYLDGYGLAPCVVVIALGPFSTVDRAAPSGEKAIKFSNSAASRSSEVDEVGHGGQGVS
jgi:hypothetical protein